MFIRLIKFQTIKRYCHHRPTKFGKVMDNLNAIQIKTDLTAEKFVKLEKNIISIENVLVCNFFFNTLVIPWSILFTR